MQKEFDVQRGRKFCCSATESCLGSCRAVSSGLACRTAAVLFKWPKTAQGIQKFGKGKIARKQWEGPVVRSTGVATAQARSGLVGWSPVPACGGRAGAKAEERSDAVFGNPVQTSPLLSKLLPPSTWHLKARALPKPLVGSWKNMALSDRKVGGDTSGPLGQMEMWPDGNREKNLLAT